jgi:hypothetical protein
MNLDDLSLEQLQALRNQKSNMDPLDNLSLDELVQLRAAKSGGDEGLISKANSLLAGINNSISLGFMPKINAAIDAPILKHFLVGIY